MSLKPQNIKFEDKWDKLHPIISNVLSCERVTRKDWNSGFHDVYSLCVATPEPLCKRLYQEIKYYLEEHIADVRKSLEKCSNEHLISTYYSLWDRFYNGSQYLDNLLRYLNTQYVKKRKPVQQDILFSAIHISKSTHNLEMFELAMELWMDMTRAVKGRLIALILSELHNERSKGLPVKNSTILRAVIKSFVTMQKWRLRHPLAFYQDELEKPILDQMSLYYSELGCRMAAENNCSVYMQKVLQIMNSEHLRCDKFLDTSSWTHIITLLRQVLVIDQIDFLNQHAEAIVREESSEDLANMYTLTIEVHKHDHLLKALEARIEAEARQVVTGVRHADPQSSPVMFVELLLKVHKRYADLIQAVFRNDPQFKRALDKAYNRVVNDRELLSGAGGSSNSRMNRSTELLSRYCDSLLKKSSKMPSEQEIDEKLNSCITIFRYIDDKDVFQRYYARFLGKRLIHSLSHSMDAEETMINRLKAACGYEFTNKLHRMFVDIQCGHDLHRNFDEFLRDNEATYPRATSMSQGFSIQVLTQGSWPITHTAIDFCHPPDLEAVLQAFEAFYMKKFNGRKLTWTHVHSSADIKCLCFDRAYVVNVPNFAAAVLLQFDRFETDTLSWSTLVQQTLLPKRELFRVMQSLVDSKLLLVKFSVNDDTNLDMVDQTAKYEIAEFCVNRQFTSRRLKLKVTYAQGKEGPQDVSATEEVRTKVEEDRKFFLQAAIVRIMKSRRTLKHNLLLQELIEQSKSRFTPSIALIKRGIEALIERGYIERDKTNQDEYNYIA